MVALGRGYLGLGIVHRAAQFIFHPKSVFLGEAYVV